jgi:hypothetical protein
LWEAAIFIPKLAALLCIAERVDFWDQMWPRNATKNPLWGSDRKGERKNSCLLEVEYVRQPILRISIDICDVSTSGLLY